MVLRNYQEIYDSMASQIVSRRPGLAVRPIDLHGESFISPVSSEMELLYRELNEVKSAMSVLTAEETNLENLGANFRISKTPSTPSSGIVSVGTDTLPLTDYIIPGGTLFSGINGTSTVSFFSLVDVTLPSQAEFSNTPENSPYVITSDEGTLIFAIDVPVRATITGLITNLSRGSIRSANGLSGNFNQIFNYSPLTGGADVMSDSELAALIPLAMAGGIVGTQNGYLLSALLQPEVVDAKVIGFGNSSMIRDSGKGGCIDVIVIGENLVQVEQTFEDIQTLDDLPLAFNPVILVSSVIGENLGQISQFAYSLVQENVTDPRFNSNQSRAFLRWNTNIPINDTITVKYVYNKTVNDIMDQTNSRVGNLGLNILVKTADILFVDVAVTIKLDTTADRSSVKSSVSLAIQNFLNGLTLGEELTESQIIEVVKGVSTSITDVISPLRQLSISGSSGTTPIIPTASQYIRASNVQVFLQ